MEPCHVLLGEPKTWCPVSWYRVRSSGPLVPRWRGSTGPTGGRLHSSITSISTGSRGREIGHQGSLSLYGELLAVEFGTGLKRNLALPSTPARRGVNHYRGPSLMPLTRFRVLEEAVKPVRRPAFEPQRGRAVGTVFSSLSRPYLRGSRVTNLIVSLSFRCVDGLIAATDEACRGRCLHGGNRFTPLLVSVNPHIRDN